MSAKKRDNLLDSRAARFMHDKNSGRQRLPNPPFESIQRHLMNFVSLMDHLELEVTLIVWEPLSWNAADNGTQLAPQYIPQVNGPMGIGAVTQEVRATPVSPPESRLGTL